MKMILVLIIGILFGFFIGWSLCSKMHEKVIKEYRTMEFESGVFWGAAATRDGADTSNVKLRAYEKLAEARKAVKAQNEKLNSFRESAK